jgi:peptide chain release factor subunit 1
MTELTKKELEEILEELGKHRGRHTELVTVYIPAGYDVNSVQKQLEAERSTAKNIKSSSTKKNVIDALDKIVRTLKGYKKTPEHGLAVFCGNVSKVDGNQDLQLWEIEPPLHLKSRLYRCDKEFVLDDLEKMLEVDEVFALLVMDRKEATIGLLEGKRIELLQKMTSGIPSKVRAGGQSSQRFHRITEGLTRDFYKRIAEDMKKIFFTMPKLKGILVGGPIPTKDEFLEGEYMTDQLQQKVIGRIDLGDSSESGLKELVIKSQDILSKQEIIKEQKLMKNFFEHLGKEAGMGIIGETKIREALKNGAVSVLFLSEGEKELKKGLIDGLKKHLEEGLPDFKSQTRELKKLAENIGSEVEMISTETEEGEQFLNLGGIGAILRFKI